MHQTNHKRIKPAFRAIVLYDDNYKCECIAFYTFIRVKSVKFEYLEMVCSRLFVYFVLTG